MTNAEKRLLDAVVEHGLDDCGRIRDSESIDELRRLVIYERTSPEHIAEARRLYQAERVAAKARVEFVRKVSLPDVVWRQLQGEVQAEEREQAARSYG